MRASHKKIEKIILVDNGFTAAEAYSSNLVDKLYQRYSDLLEKVSRYHQVFIFIFFDTDNFIIPSDFSKKPFVERSITETTTSSIVRFICTSATQPQVKIEGIFIRDLICGSDEQTLFYHTSQTIPKTILELFSQYLLPLKPEEVSILEGGDVIYLDAGGKQVVFSQKNLASEPLPDSYRLALDGYEKIQLTHPNIKNYDLLLFHLDLFFGTAGKVRKKKSDEEVWLFLTPEAQAISNDISWKYVAPLNEIFRSIEDQIRTHFGSNVYFIRTPFPIFCISAAGEVFCCSYNNGIFENYTENGKIKTHLYFPDYSKTLQRYTAELSKTSSVTLAACACRSRPRMLTHSTGLINQEAIFSLTESEVASITNSLEKENDINQKIIEAQLVLFEDIDVEFINIDFFETVRSRGALHCITSIL